MGRDRCHRVSTVPSSLDLDRFIVSHQHEWDRLRLLSSRGSRGGRGLAPNDLEELVVLYQRVSGHLTHARDTYGDASLTATLTRRVADAHAVIYGEKTAAGIAFRRFVRATFPGAVWRIRVFLGVSAALLLIPALAIGIWLANSDAALEASAPEEVREAYVAADFEDYYSSAPASQFATSVTVNNIQVSIMAFAVGVVLCLGTAFVLANNGVLVGTAAGIFHAAGAAPQFWGLILPHGLLEMTAVVVAGAAGLRLGWTVIDPGDLPRSEALAAEGRRSVTVILGLIGAFITAGLIEAFVTPSSLPTGMRVGVGVLVWLGFMVYVYRFGRTDEAREAAAAVSVF